MNEINLPFGEAIKRSFLYVLNYLIPFLKICLIWVLLLCILDGIDGFSSLCPNGAENCGNPSGYEPYLFGSIISGISVTTASICYIIRREKTRLCIFFGKREIRYMWAVIKLVVANILISSLVGLVSGLIGQLLGIGSIRQISILFALISFFVISILFSRYALVFPAIALENKEISFKESFNITKGNANKIFWGSTLITFPIFLLSIFISSLYMALGWDNILGKIIFSIILSYLMLLNIVLKASYYAHIYQYFIYYYEKNSKKE